MTLPTPTEQDLDRIRTLFLQMFVRAESMTRQAVRSVMERDTDLARAVVKLDVDLDKLEIEIDRRCLSCLALRHPVGHDLRLITTVMKMVTDLERIGDLAVNIAERGLDLAASSGVEPDDQLVRMGDIAAEMLRTAADAFVAGDAARGRSLAARDRDVDALNRDGFQRWVAAMAAHPDQAPRALALTSVSKHLERIADHAVNLGEMVVFLVEGQDVRHGRGSEGPADG
jgi:phosphate transport system protein